MVVPLLLKNWNPRYALFFAAPLWVVEALGVERLLTSLPDWRLRVALLLAVLALHAPKLASHLIDGSRHDFRTAAAVVARQRPALTVFSNWAATLQYYLEPQTGQRVRDWAGKAVIDECPCLVVIGTNLWQPVLQVPGARVDILAEVTKRRLDEQPHVVRKALDYGVDGLYVSNHGGRQVDGSVGAIAALPKVVEAVRGKVPVLFDSGVRGGADAFKSLALGSAAVGIGRPYCYALAIYGRAGVEELLENWLSDFELTMGLSGCKNVEDIRVEGTVQGT